MAAEKAFLLAVVIDATTQVEALVPDRFREVQWTIVPGGAATQPFVDRVKRLLDQPLTAGSQLAPSAVSEPRPRSPRLLTSWIVLGLALASIVYLVVNALSQHARPPAATAPAPTASPAVIAEKSIAVLPFADLSEKKDQEYFSDGLAEDLLDLLAKTPGLHVIARTSSFSFKGKSDDIPTIGTKAPSLRVRGRRPPQADHPLPRGRRLRARTGFLASIEAVPRTLLCRSRESDRTR